MKELRLDVSAWRSSDDSYLAFFEAVGAPPGHGRNFNALRDSIVGGQINRIEVPYRIVLTNYSHLAASIKESAENFVDLITELGREGVPVEIRTEG